MSLIENQYISMDENARIQVIERKVASIKYQKVVDFLAKSTVDAL